MQRSIHCTVKNQNEASKLVDSLKQGGFRSEDISVLMSDKKGTKAFAESNETKAPEGAAVGAGTGALLGGGLGWLTGVGALAIPGVGPLIAAGPIMAALSGAALGGTLGGITGALIGMGIPEEDAKRYESSINSGKVLVSVHSDDERETNRAREILSAAGAENIAASREAVGTPSYQA